MCDSKEFMLFSLIRLYTHSVKTQRGYGPFSRIGDPDSTPFYFMWDLWQIKVAL
jgi:hypothetical protein